MEPFVRDPRSVFARELIAHWHAIRGDDIVPRRAALDPVRLRGSLGRILLAERDGGGTYRLRLVGETVRDASRAAVRGADAGGAFAAQELAVVQHLFDLVLATPCGVFTTHAQVRDGRLVTDVEMVTLPLRGAARGPADSVVAVTNAVALDPRHWEGVGQPVTKLTSWRFLDLGHGVPAGSPPSA
jgi:hypothetical protein